MAFTIYFVYPNSLSLSSLIRVHSETPSPLAGEG